MVQIIPENPSFSSQIGRGLGNAGASFLTQLGQSAMDRKRQLNENQMRSQEDETISRLLGEEFHGINDPALRKAIVESKLKGQVEQQKAFGKQFSEQQEHGRIKDTAQRSFNTMASLLKEGRLGMGSGVKSTLFGGQTAEDSGQFQSAAGGLEAILVDMVSRGTLSNARFKYITETLLPKPTDREKEIKGKMKALAEMLDLDPSELTGSGKSKIQGDFIDPSSAESAVKYKGKRIIDDSTGKVLRSNGREWIPE